MHGDNGSTLPVQQHRGFLQVIHVSSELQQSHSQRKGQGGAFALIFGDGAFEVLMLVTIVFRSNAAL